MAVVVPVDISANAGGARVGLTVLPPETVAGPGVNIAVGVDEGNDDVLNAVEQVGDLGVVSVAVEEVVDDVVADGSADVLPGVDLALEVDLGLVHSTAGGDVEGGLVASLVRPADGGDVGGEGGVGSGALTVPQDNLIVGVVILKPLGVLGHGSPLHLSLNDVLLNVLDVHLALLPEEGGEEHGGLLGGGEADVNLAINTVGPDVQAKGVHEVVEGVRVCALGEVAAEHLVTLVGLGALVGARHREGARHEGKHTEGHNGTHLGA